MTFKKDEWLARTRHSREKPALLKTGAGESSRGGYGDKINIGLDTNYIAGSYFSKLHSRATSPSK